MIEAEEEMLEEKQEVSPASTIYKETRMTLSRGIRLSIFLVLLMDQCSINISSGVLSSASKDIKSSMNLNDKEFGMFGSALGLGRILGSLLFISLVNTISRKWILVIALLIKSISLFLFSFTNNLLMLIGIRCLTGIAHVPLMIYIPIWIDQFGIQLYKTFFMTTLLVSVPIGKVLGYFFHSFFGPTNWKYGFIAEGCYLFASFVFFLFCPERFFSNKLTVMKDNESGKDLIINKQPERVESIFEMKQVSKKEAQISFCYEIKEILSNPVYICCLFIRSIVFGVNTAIQYWIGDYMRTVLQIDGAMVFGAYTIVAVSGPLGGLFVGSIIGCIFGGYEKKHSSLALLICHLLSVICGMFGPFFSSPYYYCLMTTLYFVFNSVVTPLIQGIILTSVKAEYKGTAFSIANFSTLVTTSGPFPLLYGVINDYYKAAYPWMAMFSIMMIASLAIIPILLMAFFRYRAFAVKEQIDPLVDNYEMKKSISTKEKSTRNSRINDENDIELQKKS